MNPNRILSEKLLRLTTKQQRDELGLGHTVEEASEKLSRKLERDMHDQFSAWCKLNGILVVHARTDRKSTIRKGWPDFTLLYQGSVICIEFKLPGEKLTEEQVECAKEIAANETWVEVCYSFEEAVWTTRAHLLKLTNP